VWKRIAGNGIDLNVFVGFGAFLCNEPVLGALGSRQKQVEEDC